MLPITYSYSLQTKKCFHDLKYPLIIKDMNLSTNEISVNTQLRNLTENYLLKHPGLTLNALSLRCGVPATTMRRLMQNGHVNEKKNEMAPHSVLSLVSYLLKEKKISKLLKIIDGPVADLLNRSFDQFIFDEETSDHSFESDLNNLLKDKTSYLIYKLAANQCGTSIEEIKNLFGLIGLQKLNDLIEQNWIYIQIDSGVENLHAKEKNFSLNLNLAHQLTHTLIDMYKPEDCHKGYNLFYSLSEGMNEAGIQKIKEIEKESIKKIFNIMKDNMFQGKIPYYTVLISDIIGITPKQITNEVNFQ